MFAEDFEARAFAECVECLRLVAWRTCHVCAGCGNNASDVCFEDDHLVDRACANGAKDNAHAENDARADIFATAAVHETAGENYECDCPEEYERNVHLALERKRMVQVHQTFENRVLFFVAFLVARLGLRKIQVVLDIVIARVQAERRLVVVNREAELSAAVVGVTQVVIEVRIDDAFVDASAPFVNSAFKIVFVVSLCAGFNACACGCCYTRSCHDQCCRDCQKNSIQFHKSSLKFQRLAKFFDVCEHLGLFFRRRRNRSESNEGALFEPTVDGVDRFVLDVELCQFLLHLRASHALEFDVRQVAEVIDEAVFESRIESLAVTVLEGGACLGELFLEELVGLALADESLVAVALALSRNGEIHDQVERDGRCKQNPEENASVRSCRFGLVRDGVDKADIATEEFNFLLLDGRGRSACGNRCLVNRFSWGFALFDFDGPRSCRCGFVLLFSRVEPGIRNGRDFERSLFLGVEEHLHVFRGNDLCALDLLVDAVFGRHGTEIAKVGELRVGNCTRYAVALDVDGKRQGFADLEVRLVEVCVKAVRTDHSREIVGLAFGREGENRNVERCGGRFRFDRFLLDATARERHVSHLFLFFDDFRFAKLGVLELERRNLERTALGRAEPCESRGRLHFAAGTFDMLEFHVRKVVAMDNEVVAGAHVGGLEATLEMVECVEAEGNAELFAFVNGLFARGEAYGEGVVVKRALHVDRNLAADEVRFAIDAPRELTEVQLAGLFRGLDLERIDAGLVSPSAAAKEGVENIVHFRADDLIGTVEPEQLKVVASFQVEGTPVLRELLDGNDELQIERLTGFNTVFIELEGGPCAYKCC